MVSFNQVPQNTRVPLFYVEFDASRAGGSIVDFRSLLVGQRLASGNVAAGVPTLIGNLENANAAFGRGSMLAGQVAAFRRQAPLAELWCVALDDAGGATDETWTITATAAATASGTISVYVAGRLIAVGLTGATAVADIATLIAAGINAVADLPATAAAAAAVVTITARNGGPSTDLDVRLNYRADESLPPGVALTVANTVNAATDPNTQDALDAIDGEQYNVIGWSAMAAAEVMKLEAELESRWRPDSVIDGVGIGAFRGTQAQLTTYGNSRNSRFLSVVDQSNSPTPQYEWAAAVAGAVSESARADPARPFQTLPLFGVLPPSDRRSYNENNTLLSDGIATIDTDRGGQARIQRMITTWQTDESFYDLNTPMTLSFLRANFRQRFAGRYGRHKLADDGQRAPGQPIITPATGRAEAIAWAREMEGRGLIEDVEAFKESLVVERNQSDRNRLDFYLPTDLVNQFRVGAAQIAFLL